MERRVLRAAKKCCLSIVFICLPYISSHAKNIQKKRINKKKNKQTFSKTYSNFIKNPSRNNKTPYIWITKTAKSFNELIFSWNALRPEQGYTAFFVSLKYGKHWSPWQKISEWGSNYQMSFADNKHTFVNTNHVRVQTKQGSLARGFRIKAKFYNGAEKKDLHALFACCSRFKKFRSKKTFNKPSTVIRNVPKQSQMVLDHYRAPALCSPTCLCMIVNYFDKKIKNYSYPKNIEDEAVNFAEKVHDKSSLDIFGNWQLNTAQAYDESNGNVFYRVERLNSFNDLYRRLVNKIPVAVSVRYLRGGAKPYNNGHFLVVIGWNNKRKRVICLDPAFSPSSRVVKSYSISNFLQAWGRSRNLSYIPMPKKHVWMKSI